MPRANGANAARVDTIAKRTMPPRRTLVALPGVRYWRIRRMLLQQQLADLAGVNLSTVARIEAGGLAGIATLSKLAKALRVDADDLMREPPKD
jgi:DNA-binding XRE family transcriptional regulator